MESWVLMVEFSLRILCRFVKRSEFLDFPQKSDFPENQSFGNCYSFIRIEFQCSPFWTMEKW